MNSHHRAVNGGKDQYFTNDAIADMVAKKVIATFGPDASFIEPSAGDGAIVKALKNNGAKKIKAYDLEPQYKIIKQADWFDTKISSNNIIVGNPPFGFAASLAIKFFNHGSKAKAICFIVPRSFQKQSIQKRLNASFHCEFEQVLPANSFMLDGIPYDVPCVFQIWVRKATARSTQSSIQANPYITFTNKDNASYAIRRVGGNAGVILNGTAHNTNTTLFFNCIADNALDALADIAPIIKDMRNNTAGVRSISKCEIHALLNSYAKGAHHEAGV